jgi:hypothetical protein
MKQAATLLIDLQSDCILCMSYAPFNIAASTFGALKQTVLDTEVRFLSQNSNAAHDISIDAVRSECLYLSFSEGSYQLKSLSLSGDDLVRQLHRKQLANRKLKSVERLLWLELQNLKDCISYQSLDYESCINYHLINDAPGLAEYATINNLTLEQARRELEFDFKELQNKKMRIYAWHKHFISKIAIGNSVEELDQIDAEVNSQLWRDALI